MPIIFLKKASLAFGLQHLLDQTDFSMEAGEHIALIGRNGAGKTSLVSVLAGKQNLDDGECWLAPHLRVAIVDQVDQFDHQKTVRETIVSAISEYYDEWDCNHNAEIGCELFWVNPDARIGNLSGGERKRAQLALAMAAQPDLLILDEPTNHLDIETIEKLETRLAAFKAAILLISHDRSFIDKIAHAIVEIDRGNLRSYPGNYSQYQQRKIEQLQAEATENAKFDKFLAEEEIWIRKGIEARRTRNEGRVRRLEQLRLQRAARRDIEGQATFSIDDSQKSGKLVCHLEHVNKVFGNKKVIDNLSCKIMRGEKIGLVGPNGAGKSTLLKLILGELMPDSGTIERGTNLSIAYFDQQRAQLDDNATLIDTISPGGEMMNLGNRQQHVITYLADFLFSAERARAKVGSLSGGERNRLLLARLFAQPVNLLVLDEPTNDLDIDTLELLEEQLINYEGTAIIVSHDRTFLDNVATQLIVSTGDGQWHSVVGGYQEWKRIVEQKHQEKKAEVASDKKTEKTKTVKNRAEKLSFNEKRALEVLPDEIETLEKEQNVILESLNDPALYKERPDELRLLQQKLAEIEDSLNHKMQQWTELEEKASRIEKS